MNEKDVPQLLESYRDNLGSCRRMALRAPKTKLHRFTMLVPIAAASLVAIGVIVWPRDASAAALRRFHHAIFNVKSMESHMYFQNLHGKWDLWLNTYYQDGNWRIEGKVPADRPRNTIYRDGLVISEYEYLNRATIRLIYPDEQSLARDGEALDVVKAQLRYGVGKSAALSVLPSDPVNGRDTYRVAFRRPDGQRKIDILVDKETDLPISADCWSMNPERHSRWQYTFNKTLSKRLFEVHPGRLVVDLRKTIPGHEAAHPPIATLADYKVLDACITKDGTVWVETTYPQSGEKSYFPGHLESSDKATYADPINLTTGLAHPNDITILGFQPLDPSRAKSGKFSFDLREATRPRPVSDKSDDMVAGRIMDGPGRVSFSARREDRDLPRYFDDLGLEEQLGEIQFWRNMTRSAALEIHHRYLEAAKIYDRIGQGTTIQFGAYVTWRNKAADCYNKAGDKADAVRMMQEIARFKSGSEVKRP